MLKKHENADRQMFAIFLSEGIYFAEKSDNRYHVDWFVSEGWIDNELGTRDPRFEKIFRGYVKNSEVVMYVGRDFSHFGCYQAMMQFHQAFLERKELGLTPESIVRFGHNGRLYAGTLNTFVEEARLDG